MILNDYEKSDMNQESSKEKEEKLIKNSNSEFFTGDDPHFERSIEVDTAKQVVYFTGKSSLVKTKLEDLKTV